MICAFCMVKSQLHYLGQTKYWEKNNIKELIEKVWGLFALL